MQTNHSSAADTRQVSASGPVFRAVFFEGCFDNDPQPFDEPSFEAFALALRAAGHRRGPKDGIAFTPAVYRPGARRGLAGVELVTAVGLDLEHVSPDRMVEVRQTLKNLEHCLYTTHSHTPEAPRFRAVIALERELPAALYPALWAQVAKKVGLDACDPATHDASRLFYLPAAPEGAPTELEYWPPVPGERFTLNPLEVLDLTEMQYAEALARALSPTLVPPLPALNIVDGLIEKKGALALKPRPSTDDLKARVLAGEPNQWRSNLERLFAGEPFADPGGRDIAAMGCVSTIAWVAPEAEVEDIAQLFEASVEAMWAANTDTVNPPPAMDSIRKKIRRAINQRRERFYQEESIFGAASHAARGLDTVGMEVMQPQMTKVSPIVFHGLAGEIVRLIEPHSEADPVALLVQQLIAFGSAVGRGPHIKVEGDEHHCNNFIVLVGRTAKGRKGTSWGRIEKLMRLAEPVWTDDRIKGGLSSGEGLIFEVRDEVEEFDKKQQAMVVASPGVEDKRLLCYEPEYANVLKVCRREGNTLSPVVRNAWDQGRLRAMTKTSRTAATGAHISIIGHITHGELRRYMTETELGNGFANRFVFFAVERSKCLPDGGVLVDADLAPYAGRVRDAILFARGVGEVRRDPQARARWHEVYAELSAGEDSLVGALTSRAEAHVTRFALLYALLDKSTVIRLEHLEAALALWAYSARTCRQVFGGQLGDPMADELLRSLQRAPEGLNRTQIIKGVFQGHKNTADIGAAMATLERLGLAQREQVKETGGRPAEVWRATTSTSK